MIGFAWNAAMRLWVHPDGRTLDALRPQDWVSNGTPVICPTCEEIGMQIETITVYGQTTGYFCSTCTATWRPDAA